MRRQVKTNIRNHIARQVRMFAQFRSVPGDGKAITHRHIPLIIYRNVFCPTEDSKPLLDACHINSGDTVLDVGTGCGVVAIVCALAGASSVTALDWNWEALYNAKVNALLNGVGDIVHLCYCDVHNDIDVGEQFDVVIANLPMMNMKARDVVESSMWDTNLDANRGFFGNVAKCLKPHGRIYMSQADFAAVDEVQILAEQYGWNLKQINARRTSMGDIFLAFELIKG